MMIEKVINGTFQNPFHSLCFFSFYFIIFPTHNAILLSCEIKTDSCITISFFNSTRESWKFSFHFHICTEQTTEALELVRIKCHRWFDCDWDGDDHEMSSSLSNILNFFEKILVTKHSPHPKLSLSPNYHWSWKKNKLQCTETNGRDVDIYRFMMCSRGWKNQAFRWTLLDDYDSIKVCILFCTKLKRLRNGRNICNQQSKTINRQQTQHSISIASKTSTFITSTSISIVRISI